MVISMHLYRYIVVCLFTTLYRTFIYHLKLSQLALLHTGRVDVCYLKIGLLSDINMSMADKTKMTLMDEAQQMCE